MIPGADAARSPHAAPDPVTAQLEARVAELTEALDASDAVIEAARDLVLSLRFALRDGSSRRATAALRQAVEIYEASFRRHGLFDVEHTSPQRP